MVANSISFRRVSHLFAEEAHNRKSCDALGEFPNERAEHVRGQSAIDPVTADLPC
jgi:hypothetical protein